MTLFHYPAVQHRRRLVPGPFSVYQKYKPFLREEFRARCVYCRIADVMMGGFKTFTVEHYYPKERYRHLITEYGNLFYACPDCNRWKQTWPFTRSGKRLPFMVPNPCATVMNRHLQYETARVVSRSEDGARTLELLHLNHPLRLQIRELWMAHADLYVNSKQRSRALKRHLKKRAKSRPLAPDSMARIETELRTLEEIILRLDPTMKELRRDG